VEFAKVAAALDGWGFMTPWQGRRVYDHLREAGAREVLEIGTAHGVSASYMAAALAANGGGRVTTVDRYHFQEPSPEHVVATAGIADLVAFVRVEHSSYCWWLKERVLERSDASGNCEPLYDFCYLDGSHELHMDGLAVVLIERLLKPGGWLLMDDLDWTWSATASAPPPDLSPAERDNPPMRAVWDAVVRQHPSFSEFRLEDEQWGWARKGTGTRRYEVETTTRATSVRAKRVRMAIRRTVGRR
jgi:predicted O-methyltransferase YrrM